MGRGSEQQLPLTVLQLHVVQEESGGSELFRQSGEALLQGSCPCLTRAPLVYPPVHSIYIYVLHVHVYMYVYPPVHSIYICIILILSLVTALANEICPLYICALSIINCLQLITKNIYSLYIDSGRQKLNSKSNKSF